MYTHVFGFQLVRYEVKKIASDTYSFSYRFYSAALCGLYGLSVCLSVLLSVTFVFLSK